jgi:ABC-2 type transport system ATP-binding protein
MDPVVTATGLAFAYGDIVALHGVDLEVPPGLIGLVGANGAGKTTLIRLLLGSLQPARGTITVMGRRVRDEVLEVRAHVGYMPEGPCLPPDQTAADFMVYAAQLGGLPIRAARQRASDVLTLVGLHEERFRYMGEFSTGMEQRAKFAQAIVHDPDLVLLDEPTAGLDPEGRVEMLDLVTRLDEFGINAIVSSHVLTDIERTCEWVVMLDGGRVLRSAPLTELSVAEEVELQVLDDPGRVATALRGAGAEVTVDGTELSIRHPDGDPFEIVRDVLAELGDGMRRLGSRRTTLEDIYLGGGNDG